MSSSFPSELATPVAQFDSALTLVDQEVISALGASRTKLLEKSHSSLDEAKLDLVSAFAVNSLVWVWLKTQGKSPKETEVKTELDRVKASMKRLKEIEVRLARKNKIDSKAAKRFVASGLWKPGDKKLGKKDDEDQQDPTNNKRRKVN